MPVAASVQPLAAGRGRRAAAHRTLALLLYPAAMNHAIVLPLLLSTAALHAQTTLPPDIDNCGAIRLQIEARMRAGGIAQPALAVVEAGVARGMRVVGSCGNGRRQIVYLGNGGAVANAGVERSAAQATEQAAARAPATTPADNIPTECKDGSVVIGPDCDDPRAVRMTAAELAASLAPAPAAARASAASAAPAASAASAAR